MKKGLLSNISKIHTTELGIERIKKNLDIDVENVVEYCINLIKKENSQIKCKGKNYYVQIDNIELTINKTSYTIITAHKKSKLDMD
ncbi:MAG: DUF3781 domain-containing protein [Methanobrevibacter woesei]|nr:DUF3781 domain-containing protein [Methanobrevibacter woesei]